jgi:dCTP deaminase
MQLSDKGIRRAMVFGELGIDPRPDKSAFQPATIDLTLGALEGVNHPIYTEQREAYQLEPGRFMLASTYESIGLSAYLSAEAKGKSSLARLGLLVECAGFIDPGFHGQVVLELKNLHHERSIDLRIGMRICQVKFTRLDEPCQRPYGHQDLGNHYQGQTGPTGARTW